MELDLDTAGRLVGVAGSRLARGEATLAVAAATRALDLLGEGDGLAEECEGDWADGLRHRAAELRREARHVPRAAAAGDRPDRRGAVERRRRGRRPTRTTNVPTAT